jgi:RHS repeat-associated protein
MDPTASEGSLPTLVDINNERKKHVMFGLTKDCAYVSGAMQCSARTVVDVTPVNANFVTLADKTFFSPTAISTAKEDISDFYSVWKNSNYPINYQGVTVCWNKQTINCQTLYQEYHDISGSYTPFPLLSGSSGVGDLNGDGLTDFAYVLGNAVYVCLSQEAAVQCSRMDSISTVGMVGTVAIGDFAGDGATRLAFNTYVNYPSLVGARTHLCRYGAGQMVCQDIELPATAPNINGPIDLAGNGTVEFLGDGPTDPATGATSVYEQTVFTLAGPVSQDRLVAVTNGIGERQEVDYARADDVDAYRRFALIDGIERKPVYPQISRTPSSMAKQLRHPNGKGGWISTNFHYEGAFSDALGRGSNGFGLVKNVDVLSNVRTENVNRQDFPFVGMVEHSRTIHANNPGSESPADVVLSDTSNTYEQQLISHPTGAQSRFVFNKQTDTARRDLDGSTLGSSTTVNQYTDGWGNLTQQDTSVTGDGKTFVSGTVTTFKNDSAAWLLGLPTLVVVTKTDPVSGSLSRTTAFDYDTVTGLPSTKTIEPNVVALRSVTTYDRTQNNFGLVNSETQAWVNPSCAGTAGCATISRTNSRVYDAKGRFQISAKNALDHQEQYVYYAGTGVRKSLTGPNALTTSWTADGFGRVGVESRADGSETRSYTKQCSGDCPAYAVVAQVKETYYGTQRTHAPQVSYSDTAGHVVGTRTWGLDGTTIRPIVTAQRYDDRGRASDADQPHFDTNNAVLASIQSYDDLNRVVSVVTLDTAGANQTATTGYSGYMTTLTNAKKQVRIDKKNVIGQLESVTDANNKLTQFGYDPFGNLNKTTDPFSNVIQVNFDGLGRRKDLHDPDLGWITYDVDAIGRVWRQTSPKQRAAGQSTQFTYDNLDRMTDRVEPDLVSKWVFDTATTGIGQLAEAYTITGTTKDYDRVHVYDSLGRPHLTTQYLTDGVYVDQSDYDAWGRPMRQTYTRGAGPVKAFDTRYGATGELDRIERGGLVLWKVSSQDAAHRYTSSALGNGVNDVRSYNQYTGRLEHGTLTAAGGIQRFQEGYEYDVLGNVTLRSQYWDVSGFQESFEYDPLNRLKKSTVLGQTAQDFTYDDTGNILTKSNVNNGALYAYPTPGAGSIRPHAVQSIAGFGTFAYDDNGNLNSGAGRTTTWNSFDMPVQIDKGGVKANFSYGPEHQRIRQDRSDGSVVVYAGAQEVETKAGQVTVKTYWPAGVGVEIDRAGASTELNWTHQDWLGSPVGITDQNGVLSEKLAYDAWGRRRTLSGGVVGETISGCPSPLPADSVTPDCIDGKVDNRGYTGHEMLDQLDLVHMNGRVYDPLIGKFMSGDPLVQDPVNGQNYNRYSYVLNNPTNLTDPTGFANKVNECDAACKLKKEAEQKKKEEGCTSGMSAYCATIEGEKSDPPTGKASDRTNSTNTESPTKSPTVNGTKPASENPAIELAIIALADGRLSFWEARSIYIANTDPTLEISVDARKLSIDPPGKFEMDANLDAMAAKSVVRTDWMVHGSTTVIKNADGTMGLAKDVYDFTMNPRSWYSAGLKGALSHAGRNVETWLAGEVVHRNYSSISKTGTPFTIGYVGSPRISADYLPHSTPRAGHE